MKWSQIRYYCLTKHSPALSLPVLFSPPTHLIISQGFTFTNCLDWSDKLFIAQHFEGVLNLRLQYDNRHGLSITSEKRNWVVVPTKIMEVYNLAPYVSLQCLIRLIFLGITSNEPCFCCTSVIVVGKKITCKAITSHSRHSMQSYFASELLICLLK